ncbi:class I SAM-dependent methyltransferase family protein [Candidatus Bathyarchaeota archaeon]|nr:class I SAM-dependent methyltransferase family protein [Candidatus Bathyarchaeota archaeon]
MVVEKTLGQNAMNLVKSLNLLNERLKVAVLNGKVIVPLTREPVESDLEAFKLGLKRFQIAEHMFKIRKVSSRNLVEALKGKLPQDLIKIVPRSYDIIGDIAILDIPKELRTYAKTISEAFKILNPRVKAVLMKAGPVKDIFRVRQYVVLNGRPSTVTHHVEHGLIFRLNPLKVFFNPRLIHERQRVASMVGGSETIIDMFAGVGAFPIIIARSKDVRKIYGIDVNPEAISFMLQNIILNKLRGRIVAVLADATSELPLGGLADRVIMNLPERSLEFLGDACRFLKPGGGIIHIYIFINEKVSEGLLLQEIHSRVCEVGRKVVSVESFRRFKEVAPKEWHVVADVKVA